MQLEVASSHRIHTGYDKMNIQLQRRLLYDLCYTCQHLCCNDTASRAAKLEKAQRPKKYE